MIMCRELTDEEILAIFQSKMFRLAYKEDGIAIARALFEAARIQQTQEREVQ